MNKILVLNKDTLQLETITTKDKIIKCSDIKIGIDGYIEHVNFNQNFINNNIDMWVDEEGKIKDLKPSIALLNKNNQIIEILSGNVVFTSFDEYGNSFSLSQEQIEIIKKELSYTCMLAPKDNPDNGLIKVRILEA